MKILDRYLWSATLQGIIIAWFALVVLDLFFSFINESGKTNALYTTTQALIYLVYTIPSKFYEFFPTAVLIGALLGLGNLAAHSEFTAMRAAGVSIKNITFSIVKLGALLGVGLFIMGEWIVPVSDLHARNFKAHLQNKNIVLVGGAGLWVKEKNSIIHIGAVSSKEQIANISIYTFKSDHSALASIMRSKNAEVTDNGWKFKHVTLAEFRPERVVNSQQQSLQLDGFLDPEIFSVASVDPNQLSSSSLNTIIKHQKENDLKTDRYELIYWKRFSVPLSALVMLILAMPLLFGSNRNAGAGQRVFIGIVIGIIFYLSNRAANELGIVYGFSPIVSAFLPSLLFLGLGLFLLARTR